MKESHYLPKFIEMGKIKDAKAYFISTKLFGKTLGELLKERPKLLSQKTILQIGIQLVLFYKFMSSINIDKMHSETA